MKEIDRIQQLYESAQNEQERTEITEARDKIVTAVHQMLYQAGRGIKGEPAETPDLSEVSAALKTLAELGAGYDIKFPECENDRDAAVYLLKFLRQTLYH